MKKNLVFGVIGAGYFGKHYIRLLQDMPGVELRAVASRSFEAIEKNAPALHSSVRRSADASVLLADPEIDCVVIATPASSHCSLVVEALMRGKHVLMEKPMAMNMAEAEQIRDAVQKSGRTFLVGHQYLYHDHIQELKRRLDSGILGSVKYIFAENLYFGPIRSDIGCFQETAVHELSAIDYLFSPGDIEDVRSVAVDFLKNGRDDFAGVNIKFKTGLVAAIVVSWFSPEKVRRITIAGDKGMAIFDDRREEKLKLFLHPYPVVPLPKLSDVALHGTRETAFRQAPHADMAASRFMEFAEGEIITPAISAREPLRNQLEHFVSCVRDQREPESGIVHGIRVTRMMDEIQKRILE